MLFRRSLSLFALSAVLAVSGIPVFAQNAFETQRQQLRAERMDTLGELRARAAQLTGRTVELRGVVKGVFSRGAGKALLLQLPDNQTVLLDAPASLSIARPGAQLRTLCTVGPRSGSEVKLTVLAATDRADEAPVIRRYDEGEVDASLAASLQAPPPEIVVAREAVITGGPQITRPGSMPSAGQLGAGQAPTSGRGANLSARSLPRPRAATSANKNSFYGFDDSSRAAYADLARRYNRNLSADMADYIAASLLKAARAHELDPRFLAAIVQVESSFDPKAVSHAGATGLGQLMPFNLKPLGVGNTWDPAQNLMGAAKLLRANLNTYRSEPNGTLLAVAAYHAGVGAVNRAGKSVPKASTHKYVWKVYYAYKALAPELF